jgi:hypothetical protein
VMECAPKLTPIRGLLFQRTKRETLEHTSVRRAGLKGQEETG